MNESIPESPEKDSDSENENSCKQGILKRQCKFKKACIKSNHSVYSPTDNKSTRKSLSVIDSNTKLLTPENKNFIANQPSSDYTKLSRFTSFKKNKLASLKRVKISLFHEKFQISEPKENTFSLDTKLFYGVSMNKVNQIQFCSKRHKSTKQIIEKELKKNKKSPLLSNILHKQRLKKRKIGEINCGVGHGVKRSKVKRCLFKYDSFQCEQHISTLNTKEFNYCKSNVSEIQDNSEAQISNANNKNILSSESYTTKKFFKYKGNVIPKDVITNQHLSNIKYYNSESNDTNSIYKYIRTTNQDISDNCRIFEHNSYKVLKGNEIIKKSENLVENIKSDSISLTDSENSICATECTPNIISKIPKPCNGCRNCDGRNVRNVKETNQFTKLNLNYQVFNLQEFNNEQLLFEDPMTMSRIIVIQPTDVVEQRKIIQILNIIENELGIRNRQLFDFTNKKIFFYIKEESIIAVLIAELITSAFKMIPESIHLNCCQTESSPVKCGIKIVWTLKSHRRQGVATKLVDILRENYYCDYVMSIKDIAFNFLTQTGKCFAEKYTKCRNFKFY